MPEMVVRYGQSDVHRCDVAVVDRLDGWKADCDYVAWRAFEFGS